MLQFKPVKMVKRIYNQNLNILTEADLPRTKDIRLILETINKITREPTAEKSFPFIRNWMTSSMPVIKSKFKGVKCSNSEYGNLLYACFKVRLYRSELIDTFKIKMFHEGAIKNLAFNEISSIFCALVSLRHESDEFTKSLREEIFDRIRKFEKIQNMKQFLFVLEFILLENVSKDHIENLAEQINPILNKHFSQIKSVNQKDHFRYFSILYEIITLYRIPIQKDVVNFFREVHSSTERVEVEGDLSDILEEDKSKFSSIFEKIFQNNLKEYGFNFDTNIIIKQNEYDVVINGINKERFCPLAHIDINNQMFNRQLPNQELSSIEKRSKYRELEWLNVDKLFDHKVILDLNGPQHYLDSDCHPKETVTRKEMFKFEKLTLYGFRHYNLINSEEWEEKSKFPKLGEKFIIDKIHNPIVLPPFEK